MPNASSCMLVLPSTMAPASSNFCSTGAFAVGRARSKAGVPPVVGRSRVLMLSLTTIGSPASGPSGFPAARSLSTRVAAASAPAALSVMNTFSVFSCSARASNAST